MMATAFVYSGQGAQYFGMGQELYNEYAVVRAVFEEASATLGYDVAELCFQENDKLHLTEYTQPAILTVSYALDQLLAEKGIQPDFVAGLSLGEYTALVKANAFSFNEAISLVPAGRGKMAAVMNAERSVIEESCREASETAYVAPANYNMPTQIVIGGEIEGVDKAIEILESKGVKRIIPLKVSGPFHTALLHPAAEKLEVALSEVAVDEPKIPVVGNTEATIVARDAIKGLLVRQIESPVLWEDSVRKLVELGVDTFVEIGPGTTLSKFIKKINKEVAVYNVEDLKSLNKTLEALQK
ncbi:MAG TPA: ACP S-malonyltransferase [Trichococcus flocculiformis]|nr:ACP S-malonyltransferase [Trichococcus flocculiformis]